jgi:uncharacterized delta-60 repeat protein
VEGDEIGVAQSPILNGTTIPEANSGIVRLAFNDGTGTFGCSGTLLKNQWVLTAAHCVSLFVDRDFPAAPGGQYAGAPGTSIRAAKVDSSGRLLVAGGANGRFHLKRFTASGLVDTSFGTAGTVDTDLTQSAFEGIEDLAFQADGRIVVAGFATIGGQQVFALARYTTAGALDTSFGFLGGMLTDIGPSDDHATAVAIDSSGRAVVAGYAVNGTSSQYAVARYGVNGLPDTTFDGDGKLTTSFGAQSAAQATDAVIDASGRVVVVGLTVDGTAIVASAARYLSTGALDTTFDGDGLVRGLATSIATSVLVQGTKLLVGGASNNVATVFRLNANGSLDTTFGVLGTAQPTFFNQKQAGVVGMVLAADGKIRLGVGYQDNAGNELSAYTAIGANGATTSDRVFPENQGMVLPGFAGTFATAIAQSGSRVFVAGTRNTGGTESVVVIQPDRTSDTTFSDASFGVRANMSGDVDVLADRVFLPPGDDVALLHLSSGLLMNGSRSSFTFAGFHANPAASVNVDITCKGYGNNFIASDGTQSGFGTLRAGTSRPFAALDPYLYLGFVPGAVTPQLPLKGDSGSSCTLGGLVTGVHSRGSGNLGLQVNAARFATWASTTIQAP